MKFSGNVQPYILMKAMLKLCVDVRSNASSAVSAAKKSASGKSRASMTRRSDSSRRSESATSILMICGRKNQAIDDWMCDCTRLESSRKAPFRLCCE